MEFLYIILAVIVVLILKGIYDRLTDKKKKLAKLEANFGRLNTKEFSIDTLLLDSEKFYKSQNEKKFCIDDITGNDLTINEFYHKINTSFSQAGAEFLYDRLRTPVFDVAQLEEQEKLVSALSSDADMRNELSYDIMGIGHNKRMSMYNLIKMFKDSKNIANFTNVLCIIFLAFSVMTSFFNIKLGLLLIVLSIIYNIVSYYKEKEKCVGYLYGMKNIISLLSASDKIIKANFNVLESYNNSLKDACDKLKPVKKAAFSVESNVSGDFASIILEYFNILFHIDLLVLYRSISCITKNYETVCYLYETIGYFDFCLCIANLRKACKDTVVPELTYSSKPFLECTGMYHPDIEKPVKVSFSTDSSILVTGSNASGKSTFLKTVALNSVLAQTIHTCFADSFNASYFKVYTSMALTDSIIKGESYYITEIKALKRILNDNEITPVLCFVDEVLRGTNTVERIAASSSVLGELSKQNKLVFAATHDIELTRLLSQRYINYHFEESLNEDGELYFDYTLREGPSTTKNAILMLKAFDYDENIIKTATEMSDAFTRTGAWSQPLED